MPKREEGRECDKDHWDVCGEPMGFLMGWIHLCEEKIIPGKGKRRVARCRMKSSYAKASK
jgi:hypothetical protein